MGSILKLTILHFMYHVPNHFRPNEVLLKCRHYLVYFPVTAWKQLSPVHTISVPCYPSFPSTPYTLGAIYRGRLADKPARLWRCGRKLKVQGQRENMQTPHGQNPRSGSNRGLWCCEAAVPPASPLCHPCCSARGIADNKSTTSSDKQ